LAYDPEAFAKLPEGLGVAAIALSVQIIEAYALADLLKRGLLGWLPGSDVDRVPAEPGPQWSRPVIERHAKNALRETVSAEHATQLFVRNGRKVGCSGKSVPLVGCPDSAATIEA
jgi:hypothetical protein